MVDVWNKAVLYHFIHAIALLRSPFWIGEPCSVVVAFCRDFAVQRKFVCDGVNECSLVGRDHAAGRALFSRRLGLASYIAAEIVAA